jgi:hypothetical protein
MAQSTYTTKKAILTTQDILSGYEAHGKNFMIIDLDTIRTCAYSQYANIYIKNANGEIISPRFWKLSGQGITTAANIREPSKRPFEAIRVGLSQVDQNGEETDNMKAMRILCEVYEELMEETKELKVITDNSKSSRKQADGTIRPVYLISTKIESPMETVREDKNTGEMKDLDNPFYWISLPRKRFYNAGEIPKESTHFNNLYYFDMKKNAPDMTKPIMSFEYSVNFYNIEDFYHNSRTGRKIYKNLGEPDEESGEVILNNTNIHNYLKRGTAMVGNLKFEMVVTGRGAKLDISLYGTMHVKPGQESQDAGYDDECLDEFSERYTNMGISDKFEEIDEPNDEDI